MAKGQVTDADLASGIKNFGGLGSLGGASPRPVRDNPFRDTRAEPPKPVVVAPVAAPVDVTPSIEVVSEPPKLEVLKPRVEPEGEGREVSPAIEAIPAPLKAKRERPPITTPRAPKKVVAAPKPDEEAAGEPGSETGRENKTEVYTERVTVLLNAELRDGAEALAKELHRRRTKKGERITANTVMRIALGLFLERVDGEDLDGASSEAELLAAARKLFGRR